MSQVVIIGVPLSSYVRTARICCLEKGIPHAFETVELGSGAHRALHPWGRVPIMRHGDLQLIETSAICRYLSSFDGPSLVPADRRAAAVMEQWISIVNCYAYESLIRNYVLLNLLPTFMGQEPDRKRIQANLEPMDRDLERLDGAYASTRWIAGDDISLADLFVGPIVHAVTRYPEGAAFVAKKRHLRRMLDAFAHRSSFVDTLPPGWTCP